jgi:hypothetical protein
MDRIVSLCCYGSFRPRSKESELIVRCCAFYYERTRSTFGVHLQHFGVECVVLFYPVRYMCSQSLSTTPSIFTYTVSEILNGK